MSNKTSKLAVALLAAINLLVLAPVLRANCAAVSAAEQLGVSVFEEQINSKPFQVCRMLIKARPEQVWQVITDYTAAARIFSNLKKCQVLAEKGNTKIVHYQIRPTGSIATFQYDLEIKESPHARMEWRRVGGDFKEVMGYWKLEPADYGRSTVVTYANYCNGGLLMPQPLIRHQSRIDFPNIMTSLKNCAERTTEIAAHTASRPTN